MSAGLWTPGAAGPLEELVRNLHRQLAKYGEQVAVEVEFTDGGTLDLISISADPGYGFITLRPHPDEGEPNEIVVPIGSIMRFSIGPPRPPHRLGFSLPAGSSG